MDDDIFSEARKERDDFEDLMKACDLAKLAVKNDGMVHGMPSVSKNEQQESSSEEPKNILRVIAPTVEAYVGSSSAPTAPKSKPDQESSNVEKDDNGFIYYKCRFCGITFNFMNTLRAHERIHDVSQPYVCGKCGESFEFACQLEYHAAQHSDVDGYKCECGRTFFSYTEMLYHKHTDDPADLIGAPEKSNVVVTTPKNRTGLTVYDLPQPTYATDGFEPKHPLKVYSDVRSKPYICEYCSKSYADSRGLAYHMYSHRGEKQFNPRASRYMMGREGIGYTDAKNYYLFPRTSGYTPRY
ncbi:unnamed protein product [Caenorhabditis angaria]|uniref:Zinc finger protein unc-98 n=1 Tax=Caenorhabditis angaria TaxID=860376 RepID=A0A9P1IXA6_9PELO|nr:unnamed protein product [Caenorhabditis angaria]